MVEMFHFYQRVPRGRRKVLLVVREESPDAGWLDMNVWERRVEDWEEMTMGAKGIASNRI